MTEDKSGKFDEFPGNSTFATGSCLPNGFVGRFPDDGVLEIKFVGLGGIRGRSEKIRGAVAKPCRRVSVRLSLLFRSFNNIREAQADEGAEEATAHRLLGVIKVITGD